MGPIKIVVMSMAALAPPFAAMADDPAAGQAVFRSQCGICHSPQPGRTIIGSSLYGVVGRHSGQALGFHYSMANLQSGLTWDPATLDRYLANPQQVVPGTLMTFPGLNKPEDRANVIAYLKTLR